MTDFTPILNMAEVAPNQNQKEATINTALAILEASANDTFLVDLSTGDHLLSIDEFTQSFVFVTSGNTIARNLDTPAPSGTFLGKRTFVVSNTGSFDLTVRPGGSGSGNVTVTAGEAALLSCSGTAITTLSSGAAPVSGSSFLSLSDVPGAYTGNGLFGVRVKTTEDGLEFFAIPMNLSLSISGLPDASQKINMPVTQALKLPASLAGSQAYIGTHPTLAMTFALNKISGVTTTSIGSVAIATTGIVTFTFAAATSFAAGDILQVIAPSIQDVTGADVGMSFKATLQ